MNEKEVLVRIIDCKDDFMIRAEYTSIPSEMLKMYHYMKDKEGLYIRLENCDEKMILTPLAETEIEKHEMEKLEKKKFDEAERCGVVMRRIEYTHLLDHRDSLRNSLEEEKRLLSLLRDSVDKIERSWLRYRNNKNMLKNKNNGKNEKEAEKEEDEEEEEENVG